MSDAVAEFVAVMRRLRAECPWKQEQTHRSLTRYLLEETHETIEAIDAGDMEHLGEELGDLLLQIVFHAVIAEETGAFTLDDVARGITEKMRRRNPHVFGPDGGRGGRPDDRHETRSGDLTSDEVNDLWERAKAEEKADRNGLADGVPPGLPALLLADKMLDRLARAGREIVVDPASTDLGERLLALVAEARAEGADPEQALRDAVRRRL